MPVVTLSLFRDDAAHARGRTVALYAVLAAANGAAWLWAVAAFRTHPLLLGTALLAYSLGLRHAIDADHIAAIDNVTRKLMQEGKRPVAVGFFFSLGHSTVVVLAAAAIAATAMALSGRFAAFRTVGGVIGTSVSAAFLLLIGVMNLFILTSLWRTFRQVRSGGRFEPDDLDSLLAAGGPLARVLRPLFRLIRKSWHMYPLGLLFGLGFDTATEIGLLAISAAEATKGMSIWTILVFPALFTAGMSLVDTTDSVLMVGAYGWAFTRPIRKLYYNVTITSISVLVALLVGGVEALALLADRLHLSGGLWSVATALNGDLGTFGYVIIAVFVGSWAVSGAIYRLKGYDALDATAGAPAALPVAAKER